MRDEAYVIDMCDEVLEHVSERQHRFPFLVGDAGTMLPVDAYYASLALVIEYHERQHTEPVLMFDQRITVGGVTRGVQREQYDQRRRDELPRNGIQLVEFSFAEFDHDRRRRLRRRVRARDLAVIRTKLTSQRWSDDLRQVTRRR